MVQRVRGDSLSGQIARTRPPIKKAPEGASAKHDAFTCLDSTRAVDAAHEVDSRGGRAANESPANIERTHTCYNVAGRGVYSGRCLRRHVPLVGSAGEASIVSGHNEVMPCDGHLERIGLPLAPRDIVGINHRISPASDGGAPKVHRLQGVDRRTAPTLDVNGIARRVGRSPLTLAGVGQSEKQRD